MDMCVINLDRSTERLATFKSLNAHCSDIMRLPAVDGKTINRQELIDNGIMASDVRYTDGAIGAAMSHLMLWNMVRQNGRPMTIIEDDAILCANFADESRRLIAALPQDWEIALWGYNFDTPLTYHILPDISHCVAHFDQDAMRRKSGDWPGQVVSSTLYPLFRTLGIACYSISPKGAETLFQFCTPFRPMETSHPGIPHSLGNTGIDNMMAFAWPAMKSFVAVPPLALTRNDHGISTVQVSAANAPRIGHAANELLGPPTQTDLGDGLPVQADEMIPA